MPERETNKADTAEQFGQKILKFVEGTEFGTPQYEAVSDFLDLNRLKESLKTSIRNSHSNNEDPERRSYWESQARITELEIALLNHQADQRQSRVKGYQAAFVRFGIGLEELQSITRKEADEKIPENKQEQINYQDRVYSSVVLKAEDIINGKRD